MFRRSCCLHIPPLMFAGVLPVLFAAPSAAQARVPERKPAVLFVVTEYNPMYNLYLKKYCREDVVGAGFETDVALWTEITWERVKAFNAIVLVSVGLNTAYGRLPEPDRQVLQVLQDFVKAGGGLLLQPLEGSYSHVALRLAQAYGLTFYEETVKVRDPQTQMREPTVFTHLNFAYTTNIAPSPVTEGVKGIWFPVEGQKQWLTLTYPCSTEAGWQTVVKGMDYTYSVPISKGAGYARTPGMAERERGVDSEVPFFAIRDVNPGRVAYCGIAPPLTCYGGVSPGIDRVVLSKGIGERPSDCGKLLLNTFRWLSEPSLRVGTLGGHQTDPARLARTAAPPEDWTPPTNLGFAEPAAQFRGIIGAQSTYSGGKSTPAEYKAAAQQAGLQYVAFLEDIAALDEAKYEALKKECAALSDEQVTLLPGFRVEDETGNHWYHLSRSAPRPDSTFFTEDGKKFRSIFDPKGGGGWIAQGRYYLTNLHFHRRHPLATAAARYSSLCGSQWCSRRRAICR